MDYKSILENKENELLNQTKIQSPIRKRITKNKKIMNFCQNCKINIGKTYIVRHLRKYHK